MPRLSGVYKHHLFNHTIIKLLAASLSSDAAICLGAIEIRFSRWDASGSFSTRILNVPD
jgi:hypothetical protein